MLRLAVKGHLIVGFLRLYGFNVFRNTYKPLLAESIVEFWNRYYYYFKELLVTFFFMPTFTGPAKRLRHWPRLRLLAAVFAAAFVGNVYYHVIKESEALAQGQLLAGARRAGRRACSIACCWRWASSCRCCASRTAVVRRRRPGRRRAGLAHRRRVDVFCADLDLEHRWRCVVRDQGPVFSWACWGLA